MPKDLSSPLELETALGGKFPAAIFPSWFQLFGWFLPGEYRTMKWQTGAIQPDFSQRNRLGWIVTAYSHDPKVNYLAVS